MTALRRLVPAAAVLALTLFAYRNLPGRSFAADDFQWLLSVRGLGLSEALAAAFGSGAQAHFFRPTVWLLLWAQLRLFGLDAAGYHLTSLGLHLVNAVLLVRLLAVSTSPQRNEETKSTKAETSGSGLAPPWLGWLAAGLVLVHPAPFEAVVWVSAQADLLAALLLLLMLHCWLRPGLGYAVAALVCYTLALLTKETAVVGLPLLALCSPLRHVRGGRWSAVDGRRSYLIAPTLLTALYLGAQAVMQQRNYLVAGGGYGFGPQLVLNPLRSLALLAAPLPGTEHADATWLPWFGALVLVALVLLAWRLRRGPALLALLVTLAPTAPFASPPDSRYLYIPLLAFVALLVTITDDRPPTTDHRSWSAGGDWWSMVGYRWLARRSSVVGRRSSVVALAIILLLCLAAAETGAREARFAAGAGPGASLFQLARSVCAGPRLNRMLLVEPPLPAEHATAAVTLACGDRPRPLVVGRQDVATEFRSNSVVVTFPDGTATLQTPPGP